MIDWIDKMPDSMTGVLAATAIWFGFNYAVLAERAMAKDHAVAAPSCIEALNRHQRSLDLRPGSIGTALGIPGFDQIEREVLRLIKPRILSEREKSELCVCAARTAARTLRFDYAIHTASFRIIEPSGLGSLGTDTITTLMSGICGALPSIRKFG